MGRGAIGLCHRQSPWPPLEKTGFFCFSSLTRSDAFSEPFLTFLLVTAFFLIFAEVIALFLIPEVPICPAE